MAQDATAQAISMPINAAEPISESAPAAAVDPRDAIYAKKEQQFRKMQQQFNVERDALKAKMAEYETGYVPRSRIKESTWDVLNESGVDYNKLTEEMLNQPNMNDPATRAMMNKLKALEDKQSAVERQQQESTQKQYSEALNAIKNEAQSLIDSDVAYETVKAEGMADAVVELIEQTWKDTNVLMDTNVAAQQVEDYLIEQGTKFANYKKVQAKLVPKAPEVTAAAPKVPKIQTPQIKTLTNNLPSQAVNSRKGEKERIARAMAAFNGELK